MKSSCVDDWGPTGAGQEWHDQPAYVEVTPLGQYLMRINFSSYTGAMYTLMAVQHRQYFCRNILVSVGRRNRAQTLLYGPVYGLQFSNARLLSLILLRIGKPFNVQ